MCSISKLEIYAVVVLKYVGWMSCRPGQDGNGLSVLEVRVKTCSHSLLPSRINVNDDLCIYHIVSSNSYAINFRCIYSLECINYQIFQEMGVYE